MTDKTENEDFNNIDYSNDFIAPSSLNIEANKQRGNRSGAISRLAIKADKSEKLGDMYTELMGTNAMQTAIARWKDTGNSKIAIDRIDKIKGGAKDALDMPVGEKGRTIRDYLYHTMASATNDLHLLEEEK